MKLLNRIREIRDTQKQGKYLFCPISISPLNRDFTGFNKSDITIITSGTSSYKTTLTKFLLINSIENCIKSGFKQKIIYFGLEETKSKFGHSILSYLLFKNYGDRYSTVDFEGRKVDSKGNIIHLSDDVLEKIESLQDELTLYLSYFIFYDNINTPGTILKTVRNYCKGKVRYFNGDQELTLEQVEKEASYTRFEDTDELITVVVDHISLINSPGKDLYAAIDELMYYSKSYMQMLYQCNVILIQQAAKSIQQLESVKNDFYFTSIASLSDNKSTSNSAFSIIGITCPVRAGVKKYKDYDLERLRSHFIVVEMLKNRYGRTNIRYPFFADGKTGNIYALPSPKDEDFTEKMEEFYQKVENYYKNY